LFRSIQMITLSSNNINASIEFIDESSEEARKYMLDIINLTMLPSMPPHPLARQVTLYFASIDYYIVISTNQWNIDPFKEFIDYFGGLQLEIPD
jgi:hypothetical protein